MARSNGRTLARVRKKVRIERRQDFLREVEKARLMTPEQRLQTALDLIDSLLEIKEAAKIAKNG